VVEIEVDAIVGSAAVGDGDMGDEVNPDQMES
jgi:hypothetical protein